MDRHALPQSHRLRIGRVSEHGRIYLVTCVCKGRQPWFSDLSRGRCVVTAMRRVQDQAQTLCYVVMPDHVHWMMQLCGHMSLSQTVQMLKSIASKELHRCHGLSLSVWGAGFHDRALRREEDMLAVARYVVANPLRAGLVARLGDYPLWDAAWV